MQNDLEGHIKLKARKEALGVSGEILGYRRVSSSDQNLDRQDLGACDHVWDEKLSGKNSERPEMKAMLKHARKGDLIVVYSLDRLGRSLNDLSNIVTDLQNRNISVHFLKEKMQFQVGAENPFDKLLFSILAGFAEFERSIILDRQKAGIAIAKSKGKFKNCGRRIEYPFDIAEAKKMREGGASYYGIAKELGCSVATLHRKLNQEMKGQLR
jgi:DNA invertase Pin-like site-specific DNA recombinase